MKVNLVIGITLNFIFQFSVLSTAQTPSVSASNVNTCTKIKCCDLHKESKSLVPKQLDTVHRYADMHAHVTLKHVYTDTFNLKLYKHYFVNYKPNDDSAKDKFLKHISRFSIESSLRKLNWKQNYNEAKLQIKGGQSGFADYTQCTHKHIAQLNYSIIGASLTPPEKFVVNGSFRRKVNAKLVSHIPEKNLIELATANSDLSNFINEYIYLKNQNSSSTLFPGRTIKFVKCKNELIDALDSNQTAMILTIEGCHVLSNDHNNLNRTTSLDGNGIEKLNWDQCDSNCVNEVKYSISILKNLDHRLFFIEPGHFYWNNISGCPRSMDKPEFRFFLKLFPNLFTKKYGQGIIDIVYPKEKKLLKRKFFAATSDPSDLEHFPYVVDMNLKRYDRMKEIDYENKGRTNGRRNRVEIKSNGMLGWKVIEEFLSTDNKFGKPTYIDLKHMDVMARIQYINYVKDRNKGKLKCDSTYIPLFVSHTTCSGENVYWASLTSNFPFFDRYRELINPKKYYSSVRKKWINDLPSNQKHNSNIFNELPKYAGYFYPWGINLYDEEIEAIYQNNGLIGLMLDERTLGYGMKATRKYYKRSKQNDNFKYQLERYNAQIKNALDSSNIPPLSYANYVNFEPFYRNLFYILNRSGLKDIVNGKSQLKPDAWNHVCIGSDFDGFINPIDIVPTAADLDKFREYIKHYFNFFITTNPHVRTNKQNEDIWDERILAGQKLDILLNKLFYENAEMFTIRYF